MADQTADVQDAPAADAQSDPIMDILTEGTQDSSKSESSPAKETKPEVAEGKVEEPITPPDVPVKDETDKGKEDVADDTAETDKAPEDTDSQPQDENVEADKRKQQLSTEIRDLVSKRNALRTEVEKINADTYQPATEDELIAQGLSPTDAKLQALDQRIQVKEYNDRVADAQLTIESESQRVLDDFPMFDPNSKDYNKDVAEAAADIMNDGLIRDENTGVIIGTTLSPYKFYKALAASHSVSAQAGQLKGQKAAEEMLSRADDTPNAAPKTEKKDPILAILEDVDGD